MQLQCQCDVINSCLMHTCVSPLPPLQCEHNSAESTPLFSLGVFKSSARSSFCGGGILHCNILISPRPLTTPRCVFAIKPKQKCAELLLLNIACQRRIRAGTPRPVFVVANSILRAEFSPCGFRACLFSQAPRTTPRCVFCCKTYEKEHARIHRDARHTTSHTHTSPSLQNKTFVINGKQKAHTIILSHWSIGQ